MQDENTLISLGFVHYPDWDFEGTKDKNYRKDINKTSFRAYVVDCNGPLYVSMGQVVTKDGKVKNWLDCASFGSVERKINKLSKPTTAGQP
jgi:hypothetical protein